MQTLNLSPQQRTTLVASRFPEPADAYTCDKCGRDISKHLHLPHGHARRPFGPSRYVCACGEKYLSGAAEWDERSDWEQRQSIRDFGLGIVLVAVLLLLGMLEYLAFHRGSGVLLAVAVVGLLPLVVIGGMAVLMLIEPVEIVASLWRTRIVGRLTSKRDSEG